MDFDKILTKQSQSMLTKERPDFGANQVRSVDELEVGKIVAHHSEVTGTKSPYKIISIGERAIEAQSPRTVIRGIIMDSKIWNLHFADMSILPYNSDEGEMWNNGNWIEQLDAETFDDALELI